MPTLCLVIPSTGSKSAVLTAAFPSAIEWFVVQMGRPHPKNEHGAMQKFGTRDR